MHLCTRLRVTSLVSIKLEIPRNLSVLIKESGKMSMQGKYQKRWEKPKEQLIQVIFEQNTKLKAKNSTTGMVTRA